MVCEVVIVEGESERWYGIFLKIWFRNYLNNFYVYQLKFNYMVREVGKYKREYEYLVSINSVCYRMEI